MEAVLRYVYHASTATSFWHELREILKGDITGEFNHATFLADKIAALGGEVTIKASMPKEGALRQGDARGERRIGA